MVAIVWQYVCTVFLLCTSLREGLSCGSRDVQEIVKDLDLENRDWETLAGWLEVNAKLIRENCATSTALGQCYRRELVKTYCDQRGGDPERVKEDIREALKSGRRTKRQGGQDENFYEEKLYLFLLLIGLLIGLLVTVAAIWNKKKQREHDNMCTRSGKEYDRVLNKLSDITKTLQLNPGARDKLTLLYQQEKWLDIAARPAEGELVRLALDRIKQDPSQFDLFIDMLHDTEGMDLIVTTLTAGTTFSAITEYASYLKNSYKKHSVAPSDKLAATRSMEFIKLALVKKEKVSQAQANKFTRLTLQGDIDEILGSPEAIEMNDILKADDKVRIVVVEGAPGIGKSTLAWELCRQWPTLESLKRFSLVVHHKLREEGVRLATVTSDLFPCKANPGLSKRVADEVKYGNDVLFVFDGFDELPDDQRKSVESSIMQAFALLPEATILVTSRPSATADLKCLLQSAINKCVEIVGFSKAEINKYAESVLPSETLASFNAYLSANPAVKGMMYNPFNCAMIVSNYNERYESGKPVPHTQTQLYTELTLCLLSRYLNAMRDPLASEVPNCNRLEDLPHDSDLYKQLVKVAKLAFERKPKYAQISKLPEGCSDLGLLVERTVQYTRKKTTTYNFFHLTLQEYMSAFHISQCQPNVQRTLFSEHSTSMDVVWRFVAGLTKLQNIGWEEFKKIKRERASEYGYECEYKVEDDVVTVGPFLLQCLYEAQESQRIFSHRSVAFQMLPKDSIEDGELSNVVYALGYCISICKNAWNVKVGKISRESLEMLVHGMNSVDYGGGSIEELNFTQCKGIMNEGEHLSQIPHQILKCIKSLTFRDSGISQIGLENLAKCIPDLDSLTSLEISDNKGGNGILHPVRVKGSSLSCILRGNTSLKQLTLHIPLDEDEVHDIIGSLKDNDSLERLNLSEKYHSHYDLRLDHRISFS